MRGAPEGLDPRRSRSTCSLKYATCFTAELFAENLEMRLGFFWDALDGCDVIASSRHGELC